MQAPKLIAPLLALVSNIRDALSKDSDGGKRITSAELRGLFDTALDTAQEVSAGPVQVGDTVLVRIDARSTPERWRPAIVTQMFDGLPYINATVFLDGLNDARHAREGHLALADSLRLIDDAHAVIGSASEGTGPGQWRRA